MLKNIDIKSAKTKEFFIFLSLIFLIVILLIYSDYKNAILEGISLWFTCIVPSVFPYLFITAILSSLSILTSIFNKLSPITKFLFNCNGNGGYALFISFICGYPSGAKCVCDLKSNGLLSDTEGIRASCFCAFCSPVFLISTVGQIMFNDKKFGLLLLLTNIISTIIVGIIFSFYKRKQRPTLKSLPTNSNGQISLYNCAYSSVISLLIIGALITVFYLLTEILSMLKIIDLFSGLLNLFINDKSLSNGIVFGIFECTKGLKVIAKESISIFTLPICASICGFGGLSVILQSTTFLKRAKIKTAPFILSRIITAIFSFVIGFILAILFY